MIIKSYHFQMKKFKTKIVHNIISLNCLENEEQETSLNLKMKIFINQKHKQNLLSLNKIKFQK